MVGEGLGGSQNPRIWQGNVGEHRASTRPSLRLGHGPHRHALRLGCREGNRGALIGELAPGGEHEDVVDFRPSWVHWFSAKVVHSQR